MDPKSIPAYPCATGATGEDRSGMTLRDHFAALAMSHIDSSELYIYGSERPWKAFAEACYDLAEEMMVVRNEQR